SSITAPPLNVEPGADLMAEDFKEDGDEKKARIVPSIQSCSRRRPSTSDRSSEIFQTEIHNFRDVPPGLPFFDLRSRFSRNSLCFPGQRNLSLVSYAFQVRGWVSWVIPIRVRP